MQWSYSWRSSVFLLTLLVRLSRAWWDEGHMVLAAVARLSMDAATVIAIESQLSAWEKEFPGMSDMVSAAVWPDHIKCTHRAKYCSGTVGLAALEIFNTWHYVELVYNPQKVELSPAYKLLPLPGTGALYAMRQLLAGINEASRTTRNKKISKNISGDHITGQLPAPDSNEPKTHGDKSSHEEKRVWDNYSCDEDNSACRLAQRPNRHEKDSAELEAGAPYPTTDESKEEPSQSPSEDVPFLSRREAEELLAKSASPLSPFSWNMRFRLLIHILGDVHQPLHATETVSRQFPDGDFGGNKIRLNATQFKSARVWIPNLHAFWDSCAGLHTRSWPTLSSKDAIAGARALIRDFPPSYFNDRGINVTFAAVGRDSHNIARLKVMDPLADWSSATPFGTLPRMLSEEYIQQAKHVCQEQLALGGYRLAALLEDVVRRGKLLHDASTNKTEASSIKGRPVNVQVWANAVGCILVLTTLAMVIGWYYRRAGGAHARSGELENAFLT